jgi:catechol O-methyltransferase
MSLGKRLPFLRWSFIRLGLGMRHLLNEWQVGDGREEACARYVLAHARPGSIDDAIRAIDEYAYRQKFLINVGDEKGQILDAAIETAQARRVLELGAYVGYSALRIVRKLPPGGRLYSIEFSAANANIVRRVLSHAGASDRVTVIHGSLGDGGTTIARLNQELTPGALDLVFVDHAKDAYVPDLKRILEARWLHAGSVVVADNVGFPGAPEYKAFMAEQEGTLWRTVTHETHAEYQTLIKDLVLESTLIR